ncbi:hypothetical protein ACT3TU_10395, partial [Psychrobacter sp. AOP3-A1-26]
VKNVQVIEKDNQVIEKNTQVEVTDLVPKMVGHIIFAITLAHLLNDLIQAALPAIYPLLEPPRYCRRLNILREYDNEKTNLHS